MAIYPIETVQGSSVTSAASSAATVDKNEFLMLFVTQLQNQDPLNPMDNADMATQTAQFASLEQLQNINSNLENLQKYQAASFDENAVSFIGKQIKATASTVELTDGEPVDINFDLEKDATAVYVTIYDSNEELVTELIEGAHSTGSNTLSWDGTLGDGVTKAPDGTYRVSIKAVNQSLTTDAGTVLTFTGVPFYTGIVSDVNFWDGTAYLTVGGREIPIANVQKVSEPD